MQNAKRKIQYAYLKADKVDEYVALHADPFPEIMYDFRQGTMRNYTIWIRGMELYTFLEIVPGTGLLANGIDAWDETKLRPKSLASTEWGRCATPCFLHHDVGVYFINYTEIAYAEGEINESLYDVTWEEKKDPRQKRVFRGRVDEQRLDEYLRFWESHAFELSDALATCHFGNLSVSLRENEVYIYYEYCGEHYEEDMLYLLENKTVAAGKAAAEAFMIPYENGCLYEEFERIFYSA